MARHERGELLARGQPTDPAERDQVLRDLVGQIERLSTLVADLIDLAHGFLQKPYQTEELGQALRGVLESVRT